MVNLPSQSNQDNFNAFAISSAGFCSVNVANTMYMNSGSTVSCIVQVQGGSKVVGVYGAVNGGTAFSVCLPV